MRLFITVAAFCAGAALADEPAACYMASDPTGNFRSGKTLSIDAYPETGAQIRRLLNENNRAVGKCIQRHVDREGWPANGASILYGLRISPEGKLTQVSVLEANDINDGMLMACIGRTFCNWDLAVDTKSQQQLVGLPVNLTMPVQGRSTNRLRH
ncbi:hypothetical protein NHH73_27165 [Oxalobacteraceae bacterium OTU3CINTB1]|nr:hypothetical protein NHH73_27165 [Oxalobacteraceae bacterium OTU3CINTB1]